MGILNKLFKKNINMEENTFDTLYPSKSSKKIYERNSKMLEKTLEKAKQFGGDPFLEYRGKGILPEKFYYGMNCFLDRIAEESGERFVQKVYEELKNTPNSYTMNKEVSTYDVAGIPTLFGLKASICISIHNNAITRIKDEMSLLAIKLSTEKPYFLQKLENETESEHTWRLAVIDMGLALRIIKLDKLGKYFENEQLKVYLKVIEDLVCSIKSMNKELSDEEFYRLQVTATAVENIIPDEEADVFFFLSQLSIHFWNTLLESAFYNKGSFWTRRTKSELAADEITDKIINSTVVAFEGYQYEALKVISVSDEAVLDQWWSIIKSGLISIGEDERTRGTHFRGFALANMVAAFLFVCGYKGTLREMLQLAERHLLRFLFNRVADELGNEKKVKWYLNKTDTYPINGK